MTVTKPVPAAELALPALRMGQLSLRVNRRPVMATVLMTVIVAVTVGATAFLGDYPLPAPDVLATLVGQGTAVPTSLCWICGWPGRSAR